MYPPEPSRVNTLFLDGPIFHWRSITNEQACALGVASLPPAHPPGAVAHSGGATARRLKSGKLNVSIIGYRPRVHDAAYRKLIERVMGDAAVARDPVVREEEPSGFAPMYDAGL